MQKMEYVSKSLRYMASFFIKQKKEIPETPKEISRIESYIELSYKILNWEDPALTWTVFLVLNFLFWLAVQWELKILGIIFLFSLIVFIGDFCFERIHKGPFYSHYSDSLNVLKGLADLRLKFKLWREDSPSSFCIVMSFGLLMLTFTARNVSGYFLFYILLLAIFFLPLSIANMPQKYLDHIKTMFAYFSSSRDVLDEEEFIPFDNERDPELESQLTDKTADSVTNSLTSGISAMPSYIDADEIPNDLEEEDLIFSRTGISCTPGNLSSDSDSEHQEIHFDPTHFNGDTSSEDEKLLEKGLTFADEDATSATNTKNISRGFSRMVSDIASTVGSRVVSSIMQAASSNSSERKNSSSDSEFEIIEKHDLPEQT